jgi:hypothetical protein
MWAEVGTYLEEVRNRLHLDPKTERRVVRELYSHFQEKIEDLRQEGLSGSDAELQAIRSFGSPRLVARLMDQAYSAGSWVDALVSAQPHLIIASLLATHLWQSPLVLGACFLLMAGIGLYGWHRQMADSLYSWIGCALIPLGVAAYLCRHVIAETVAFLMWGTTAPALGWQLLLTLGLYGGLTWVGATVVLRMIKKDWLFVSLMLLPFPLLGFWLLSAQGLGDLFGQPALRLPVSDLTMAAVFALLGVVSALLIRLRPRLGKLGALWAGAVACILVVICNSGGSAPLAKLAATVALSLVFLLGPALLHARAAARTTDTREWLREWIESPPLRP